MSSRATTFLGGTRSSRDGSCAKEAFATDPSLELLVPPKKVIARELIDAWLSEDDTVNN